MQMPPPRVLTEDELTRQIATVAGIRHAGGRLEINTRAPSFAAAIDLVRLVAEDAETMNHHPDIDIRWRNVRFALVTHSAGGITQFDIELGHQILLAAASVGAEIIPSSDGDPA